MFAPVLSTELWQSVQLIAPMGSAPIVFSFYRIDLEQQLIPNVL